jgi:hypothetical protein
MTQQKRRQPANVRLVGQLTASPHRNLRWPLTLAVYPGESQHPLCESQFCGSGPLDVELLGLELAGRLSSCEVLRIELCDARGDAVAPTQWLGGAGELALQIDAGAHWPEALPVPTLPPLLDGEGQAWLRIALEEGLGIGDASALLTVLEAAREPLESVHRGLDPAHAGLGPLATPTHPNADLWATFCSRFGEPLRARASLFTNAALVEMVAQAARPDAEGPPWTGPAVAPLLAELAAFECVADLAERASDGNRGAARVLRSVTSADSSLAAAIGCSLGSSEEAPFGVGESDLQRWLWERYRPAYRALRRLAPWSVYELRSVQVASGASYACAGGVLTIYGDGIDSAGQQFEVLSPGGAVLARVPARPVIGGAAITLPARAQLAVGAWPASVRLRPRLESAEATLDGSPHRVNGQKPAPGAPPSLEIAVADLRGTLEVGSGRVVYAPQRVSSAGHVCGGEVTLRADVEDFVTAHISHKGPSGSPKRLARRKALGEVDGWQTVVPLGGAHGLLTPGIHRVRLEARNAGCRLKREVEIRALHVREAEITELLVNGESGTVSAEVGQPVTISWTTEGACNVVLTAERLDTVALRSVELEPGASSAVVTLRGPTTFTLHAEGAIIPARWSGHATPVRTRRMATVAPRVALAALDVGEDPVRFGEDLVVRWQADAARSVAVSVEPQTRRFGPEGAGVPSTALSEEASGEHIHRVASRSATHLNVTVTALGFDGRTSTRQALVRVAPSIASAALEEVSECGEIGERVGAGGTLRIRCGGSKAEPGGDRTAPSVRLSLEVCNATGQSVMLSLGGRRAPMPTGEPVALEDGWPVERGSRGTLSVTAASGAGEELSARASFGIELT